MLDPLGTFADARSGDMLWQQCSSCSIVIFVKKVCYGDISIIQIIIIVIISVIVIIIIRMVMIMIVIMNIINIISTISVIVIVIIKVSRLRSSFISSWQATNIVLTVRRTA